MKAHTRGYATLPLTALALALALVVSACREVPVETLQPEPPEAEPGDLPVDVSGIRLVAAECRGDVRQRKVECAVPTAMPDGLSPDIIVGGQNQYVTLASSNVFYDGSVFTFDVTLRNRIPQPMGTTNDVTLAPDPGGIKVFLHTGPTVTGGTGTITVNPDGTGTFTGAGQPYYQYNTVLESFELSAPKQWSLQMPASVTTFAFTALISAPVPWPDGYIDVTGPTDMRYTPRQFAGTVRTAVGNPVPGMPLTWASSDNLMASIDAGGLATPLRAGTITITASTDLNGVPINGDVSVIVRPITRSWTGAAGTTDWTNDNNWSPAIRPQSTDTVVVDDAVATIFPVLSQNETVGGLFVQDITAGGTIPTVSLGAFDLTSTGDAVTTNSASVTGTSGRLFLSGVAKTVGGTLPRIRVTGTYSLISNLTVTAPLRADLGRIRNTSFRLRAVSQ